MSEKPAKPVKKTRVRKRWRWWRGTGVEKKGNVLRTFKFWHRGPIERITFDER